MMSASTVMVGVAAASSRLAPGVWQLMLARPWSSSVMWTSRMGLAAVLRARSRRERIVCIRASEGRHVSVLLMLISILHVVTRSGDTPSREAARLALLTSRRTAPLASASLPSPKACSRNLLLLRPATATADVTFHRPKTTTVVEKLCPTATAFADVSARGLIQYAASTEVAFSCAWKCAPTSATNGLLVPATPWSHALASSADADRTGRTSRSSKASASAWPLRTRSLVKHGEPSVWSWHTFELSSETTPFAGS
mmetsp:Transcript_25943/g.39860  ORF Transcript_25943/g.39860 Transcript_25943/m.39860 type:complete len:255 (+) Transcript_25943:541-1305(+)